MHLSPVVGEGRLASRVPARSVPSLAFPGRSVQARPLRNPVLAAQKPQTIHLEAFPAGDALSNLSEQIGEGAAGQLAAGLQLAGAQYGPFIAMLQAQVQDLTRRLQEEQDRRRDETDEHRNDVRDLESTYKEEIRTLRDELNKVERKAELAAMEARWEKKTDSSTFDRVLEPLVSQFSALAPALMRGAAPQPAAVPVLPAPAVAIGGEAGTEATPAAAPDAADDVNPARLVMQRAEQALLAAVLSSIRGDGDPSQAAANVVTSTLARFGFAPTPAFLARTALNIVVQSQAEAVAVSRVAAALGPVVQATESASQLLQALTPEVALTSLWGLANLDPAALTDERRAFGVEVLGAVRERLLAGPPSDATADVAADAEVAE